MSLAAGSALCPGGPGTPLPPGKEELCPLPLEVTAPSSQPSPLWDKQLTPRDVIRWGRKNFGFYSVQGVLDISIKNLNYSVYMSIEKH